MRKNFLSALLTILSKADPVKYKLAVSLVLIYLEYWIYKKLGIFWLYEISFILVVLIVLGFTLISNTSWWPLIFVLSFGCGFSSGIMNYVHPRAKNKSIINLLRLYIYFQCIDHCFYYFLRFLLYDFVQTSACRRARHYSCGLKWSLNDFKFVLLI